MFKERFGKIMKKTVTFDGHVVSIGSNKINLDHISTIYVNEPTRNNSGYLFFSPTGNPPQSDAVIKTSGITLNFNELEKTQELIGLFYQVDTLDINYGNTPSVQNLKAQKVQRQQEVTNEQNRIRCPKCNSTDSMHLGNKKKAFSVGKAAGGALITGGIGTLVGFAGKEGKKERWLCNNCGNKFNQ